MRWPIFHDVILEFGHSHLKRRIWRDALGRPHVFALGDPVLLLPAGASSRGNRWMPMNEKAAAIYRGEA